MGKKLQAVTGAAADESVTPFDPAGTIQQALPEGWVWDERETVLLGILERQAKHIEQLETALAGAEYLTLTAKGEPKVNPLVAELRLQYAAMSRTAEAIRLPDVDGASSSKSVRHQRAAMRRWGREA